MKETRQMVVEPDDKFQKSVVQLLMVSAAVLNRWRYPTRVNNVWARRQQGGRRSRNASLCAIFRTGSDVSGVVNHPGVA
ncbi:hypothetical protein MJO28_002368 [Puccinia striiformis f. sp. tritici]|uniref:Uncharacterized protein n=1 Tax=Puccinia striiformis f. sp. tritici TaxID=168172 RepID=A0ACC0EYP5_9BASI|nr:hypothetical protein MJO28_002368 [Puccinia striiformis f. sp. tritici]